MGKRIILDENLVIQKYRELNNVIKVGIFFGVSHSPIKRILNSHGIKYQTRKNFVNETYFDYIDSEEKAYWLGFLCADGYIREREGRGSALGLKLSQLDLNHLELFKKCINSDHKLSFGVGKTKDRNGKEYFSKMVTLSVYSNRIVESIKTQGFHSRKTFTIDKPNIEEKYYRHFIRGFFDGDGCCYIFKKNDKLYVNYSFCCASPKLKEFITNELIKNSIKILTLSKLSIGVNDYSNAYRLYEYLYKDSTIYLQRKKDKGDEFVKYYMMKREMGYKFCQEDYTPVDQVWTEEEINTIKMYQNVIPLSYLSYSILRTKNKRQIVRYCYSHGIKNDKRLSKKQYEKYCYENNIVPYM